MKNQVKRFSEFVNERYENDPEMIRYSEEEDALSPCCGSPIDDASCCTECGEECEPHGIGGHEEGWEDSPEDYYERLPMHHEEEPHSPYSFRLPHAQRMPRELREGKAMGKMMPKKMKQMPEDDLEMDADEPMMPAKKAKPSPKMPMVKEPLNKMPMAKKAPAAKPGKAGVDLIRGAAKANAMKKMEKEPMPKMPKRGMM